MAKNKKRSKNKIVNDNKAPDADFIKPSSLKAVSFYEGKRISIRINEVHNNSEGLIFDEIDDGTQKQILVSLNPRKINNAELRGLLIERFKEISEEQLPIDIDYENNSKKVVETFEKLIKVTNNYKYTVSLKPNDLEVSRQTNEPSKNLLYFVGFFHSAKEREIVVGDVEERFRKEAQKFGRRKAHALIVRDLLVSIYPTTRAALVKLFKWATFYAILKRIIS